jgi:hypothetical protein
LNMMPWRGNGTKEDDGEEEKKHKRQVVRI